MEFDSDKKIYLSGLLAVLVVIGLNYITHTPLKLIASLIGIIGCVYAAKKLREQFDVPLIFVRRNGANYWGGAFGGIIGGISGFYGATRNFEEISFAEFGVDLSLLMIYLALIFTLFTGTILQDIEDGYIEV